MIIKKEVPDKIIDLSHGDRVAITVTKKEVRFDMFIDGAGNCFSLSKEELRDLIK